jgi:acyl carrier protein
MKPERVRDELLGILAEQFGKEVDWKDDLSGRLDRRLDSLERMSLIVAIEDHFLICFEPEDEATIEDFDDLVHSIAAKSTQAELAS